MISRIATLSVLAGAALLSANPVHASHLGYKSTHIILGKAYFYSLNLYATITSLTGRNINDGTALGAGVKVLTAETQCQNPQGKFVSGVGPKAELNLSSDLLTADNLVKADRTKSTFRTTATGALSFGNNLASYCKDAGQVGGPSQWYQLYWKYSGCTTGAPSNNTCYARLARHDGTTLIYIDDNTPVGNTADWTFVYVPSTFVTQAIVTKGGVPDGESITSWSCSFESNVNGQPYSIINPPVGGWGGPNPATYACTLIGNDVYNNAN